MPYLASNEDAREGGHGKALAIAGTIFAAAAVAGAVSNTKSVKALTKKYFNDDVVKSLYGGSGDNLNAVAKSYAQAVNADPLKGQMYEVGKTLSGAPKLVKSKISATPVTNEAGEIINRKYHKNGTMIGDAVRNYMDKDLRRVNKYIKAIYKGKGDINYSKSKLALYDSLQESTKGMNVHSGNLADVTNKVYNSAANRNIRKSMGIDGVAKDIEVTNAIWGQSKKNT